MSPTSPATENDVRRILVIDPDPALRGELRTAILQDGYEFIEAESGQEGLQLWAQHRPNMILLEVGLPDINGFDVCREVRKSDLQVGVIMLSSRSDEIDAVVGLEIGADDYVAKPPRLRELMARIAAH